MAGPDLHDPVAGIDTDGIDEPPDPHRLEEVLAEPLARPDHANAAPRSPLDLVSTHPEVVPQLVDERVADLEHDAVRLAVALVLDGGWYA
ncbi:MAG: hypothetical protein R2712_27640 [Vicinamibacterales bacterium]